MRSHRSGYLPTSFFALTGAFLLMAVIGCDLFEIKDPLEPQYFVKPDGTGDFPTIQAAIDSLPEGAEILLANGTYSGPGNRDIDFRGKSISVMSESNNPESCIIDCEGNEFNHHRGFIFQTTETPSAKIKGLSIINGYSDRGGGIFLDNASPTIDNCSISRCFALRGGGLYLVNHSSPTLTECDIDRNSTEGEEAVGGGGFFCLDSSPHFISVTISECTTHLSGGGGYLDGESNPIFDDTTFIRNSYPDIGGIGGGALYCDPEGPANIEANNCFFINNAADSFGGAIYGRGVFRNCLFLKNSAENGSGGAFYGLGHFEFCVLDSNEALGGSAVHFLNGDFFSRPELKNCTITNNWDWNGGSISLWNTTLRLESTIVAFNTKSINCTESYVSAYCSNIFGNQEGDWIDCLSSAINSDSNISSDPLFCNILTGDFRLQPGSPCLPENNHYCDTAAGALGPGCQ